MDQAYHALASVTPDRQLTVRSSEETGRISHLPPQTQASPCRTESQTGDQLQYAANQATSVQQTGVHANRRENGVRYCQCVERSGNLGEIVRGMASVRDDAPGTSRTSCPEVQAQSRHPRGLDSRQRGNAAEFRLPSVQTERIEGVEEETRGV
uniref:Uncharacterized protein n=1 Tax=Cacopsylla melanoneura TaxID=428564 RepID=A0A8D8QCQ3_9HEMI